MSTFNEDQASLSIKDEIQAFRFAEQIVVHFSCQITLCSLDEQGCEGISVRFRIYELSNLNDLAPDMPPDKITTH